MTLRSTFNLGVQFNIYVDLQNALLNTYIYHIDLFYQNDIELDGLPETQNKI